MPWLPGILFCMPGFPGILCYALVSRDYIVCPGFQGYYVMPWFPEILYCMPWFPGILCFALVSRDYSCLHYMAVSQNSAPKFQ